MRSHIVEAHVRVVEDADPASERDGGIQLQVSPEEEQALLAEFRRQLEEARH